MIRHMLINVSIGIVFRYFRFITERDFTNIEIESVFLSIVKPVSFICAHSLFIPFTGKNALATDGFEALPYTSNPSKQVNKPEGIVSDVQALPEAFFVEVPLRLTSAS